MLLTGFNEKALQFYIHKFGRGKFIGPHYLVKKNKNKVKIKGNTESVYDFSYFFLSLSDKNKINKKAIILVPKILKFETNFEILKEKVETRYRKLEVSGEGFFKADYFIFLGKLENEFGKIQTKKPKGIKEENEKDYFSFLNVDSKEELLSKLDLPDFEKELEYKATIEIKSLEIIDKKFVQKKVILNEVFNIDKGKKIENSRELVIKHEI